MAFVVGIMSSQPNPLKDKDKKGTAEMGIIFNDGGSCRYMLKWAFTALALSVIFVAALVGVGSVVIPLGVIPGLANCMALHAGILFIITKRHPGYLV
jgi:hypothetical protein